jgi:immune inhibitor A
LDATASGGTSVSLTYMGGSTGINDVEMETQMNDNRIYTLDGRYLGTELPSSFRGVYIQNGKKYVKMQ